MKIKLLLIALVTLSLISCGDEKIEREAKKAMETHFKEVAKVPNSVKLSNVDVMFSNDSLCIIHVDFTAKNTYGVDVTNREEYIYLKSSYFLDVCNPEIRTNYELCYSIEDGDDMVYYTEQEYGAKKIGEIYEGLDYPQGLYYLSTLKINSMGSPVGSKRKNIGELPYIPPLTGTGKWTRDGNFLLLWGEGTFSNSATYKSELSVQLMVLDNRVYAFKLYEYNKYPAVREDGFTNLYISSSAEPQQSNNHKFYMLEVTGRHEMITIARPEEGEEFKQLLLLGGRISGTCSLGKYSKSDYSFTLDVTGYDKALEILQAQ